MIWIGQHSFLKGLPDGVSSTDKSARSVPLAKLSGVNCKNAELAVVLDSCTHFDESVASVISSER